MVHKYAYTDIFVYYCFDSSLSLRFLSLIGIVSFDPPKFKPCVIAATSGTGPVAIYDLACTIDFGPSYCSQRTKLCAGRALPSLGRLTACLFRPRVIWLIVCLSLAGCFTAPRFPRAVPVCVQSLHSRTVPGPLPLNPRTGNVWGADQG